MLWMVDEKEKLGLYLIFWVIEIINFVDCFNFGFFVVRENGFFFFII